MNTTRIALIQQRGADSKEEAREILKQKIEEAAANGAKIVCSQELCLTKYFCTEENPDRFDLAEKIPGPDTEYFSGIARKNDCVLVISLFEKVAPGLHYNTAAILDADGTFIGKYRKSHIPQDPGFEEKFYFAPGDTGFRAWDTKYGRIGIIICWDQWYPESARLTALDGAEIIFCPTAIGGIAQEPEELAEHQRQSWLNVQKGHAVANGCYFAAVNRTGIEGDCRFWGTSFTADFYGNIIAGASRDKTEILYAECDFRAMEEHRRMWPFFRDRRTDLYGNILKRWTHDAI